MKDPKLTVRLTESMLKRFKSKLALQGKTVQAVLEWYILTYIQPPRGKK